MAFAKKRPEERVAMDGEEYGLFLAADKGIPMNVLIVDDEEACRKALSRLLEICGHEVSTAADGVRALFRIGQERPEVVITDVLMPKMDGLKLQETIEEQFPDIPIVLMTGQAKGISMSDLQAKGKLCISKPIRTGELLDILKSLEEDRRKKQPGGPEDQR